MQWLSDLFIYLLCICLLIVCFCMYVIVFGNLDVRHFIIMVFIIGNEYLYLKNFGKVYKFWPVGCIEHPHEKVIRPVRVPRSSWFLPFLQFSHSQIKTFSLNFSPYVSFYVDFTLSFLIFFVQWPHTLLVNVNDWYNAICFHRCLSQHCKIDSFRGLQYHHIIDLWSFTMF